MVAQQKKSGWFFNKNIIDEINSVPEEKVENEAPAPTQNQATPPAPAQAQPKSAPALKMVSDNTVPESPEKQAEEIKELKRLIFEKEQVLQKYKKEMSAQTQQLTKENENYRQSVLRMGEEKAQNRRQIQDLEAEVQRARQEVQRLKETQELDNLKQQLEQVQEENKKLKDSVEHLATVEQELEEIHEEHHALVAQQKDEEIQRLEKIHQLEGQINDLISEINEKDEQYSQLDKVIVEKDQVMDRMIEEQAAKEVQAKETAELREKVAALKAENEQLKQEAVSTQQEIGEVLVSARKQANRMVEKSKMDAHRIIEEAKRELALINEQAKEISDEVVESRQSVLSLYEEMQTRVDILAQGKMQENVIESKE
ncbi:hypothetical protein [Candidatus Enterococcus murrayae]|uniref:Uncharacterized protein n=1 Tax=Candidatus Enterococcus murrayae TaxID=2815321 RepID=A0ABS3HHH3_9ENTE|nr:hypothetical protein [Enterococcus sp. MJM16]MBO0452902.1 hypothetical protein [Enterococcus sp. MJM16]